MSDVTRPTATCPLTLNTVLGTCYRRNGSFGQTIVYNLNSLPALANWGTPMGNAVIDQTIGATQTWRAYPVGSAANVTLFSYKRQYQVQLAIGGGGPTYSGTFTDYGDGVLVASSGMATAISDGIIENPAFSTEAIGNSNGTTISGSDLYGFYVGTLAAHTGDILRPSVFTFDFGPNWLDAWDTFTLAVQIGDAVYYPLTLVVQPPALGASIAYWINFISGLGSYTVLAPDPPDPGDCHCQWNPTLEPSCSLSVPASHSCSLAVPAGVSTTWRKAGCQ